MATHAGNGQQVSLQTGSAAWVGGGKTHYEREWFGHDVGNGKMRLRAGILPYMPATAEPKDN
jgi:hypothetical protein